MGGADAPASPLDADASGNEALDINDASVASVASSTGDGSAPPDATASGEREHVPRPRAAKSAFDVEFWPIYPPGPPGRKTGKDVARKVFDRAVKNGVAPETIIGGLRRWRASAGFDERDQYIPGPAKWLRHSSWEAWPDQPAAPSAPKANSAAGLQPGWWRNNPQARNMPPMFWHALLEGYAPGDPWNEEMWGPPLDDPDCIVHPDVRRELLERTNA